MNDNGDFVVFDISNPVLPIRVGAVSLGGANYSSIFIKDDYAYVTKMSETSLENGGRLKILSIADPTHPTLIGSVTIDAVVGGSAKGEHNGGTTASVYVNGNYAYISNAMEDTVSIVDISNPSAPFMVRPSFYADPVNFRTTPWQIFVQGHYAYTANGYSQNINVIDISNPLVPVTVGTTSAQTDHPMGIYVR